MKKFLTLGALALTLAAAAAQEASAWTNFKFGVGMNIGYQAGGNNFAWGLFRNGQPPCSDSCQAPPMPYNMQQPMQPMQPMPQMQPNGLEQGFGAAAPPVGIPGQTQAYSRYTTQTVNYRYPYPYAYQYPYYNYAPGYYYGNYTYYR